MAIRVPAQQTQINPLGTPNVRLPQGPSQARGVSQGLREASASAQRVEDSIVEARIQLQVKRNTERVFTAENGLRDAARQFQAQMETERRGHTASGVTEETDKFFEDLVAKTANDLENDAQREAFMRSAEPIRGRHLDMMANFEAGQLDAAVSAAAQARANSLVEEAAGTLPIIGTNEDGEVTVSETEAFNLTRAELISTVTAEVQRNGGNEEQVRRAVLDTLTTAHRERIDNMRHDNPEAARAYYEQSKSEINPTDYDAIEESLRNSDQTVAAQRAYDSLIAEFGPDIDAAFTEAGKRHKGFIRDDVQRRLGNEKNRRANLQTEIENVATDEAYDQFIVGHRVDDIDREVWEKLPGQTKDSLIDQERAWWAAGSEDVETNSDVFVQLYTMGTDPDPEIRAAFTQVNIPALWGGNLAVGDRNMLIQMQDRIKEGQSASVRTDAQIVADATRGMDPNAQLGFIRTVTDAVDSRGGRGEITDKDYEDLVARHRAEVTYKSSLFGLFQSTVTGADIAGMTDEEFADFRAEFEASEIPAQDREDIGAALQRANPPIPVTDENLIRWYLLGLGRTLPTTGTQRSF